jgi:hypothetical protein
MEAYLSIFIWVLALLGTGRLLLWLYRNKQW